MPISHYRKEHVDEHWSNDIEGFRVTRYPDGIIAVWSSTRDITYQPYAQSLRLNIEQAQQLITAIQELISV